MDAAAEPENILSHRAQFAAQNRLLTALPLQDCQRLLARSERVELRFGEVLCRPGDCIHRVFFPIDSFVSLIAQTDGHASLEVGLVGDEGMVGTPLMLGVNAAALHAVVQDTFCRELARRPAARLGMNGYVYVTLCQLAQTAACTRFHLVEARLARWLLMTRDRAHADDFDITHAFLAYRRGVRRAGVTRATLRGG